MSNKSMGDSSAASEVSTAPTTIEKKQLILCSEEEEIEFLRSLGWKENGGDDEGDITEEEITTFCLYVVKYVLKLKTALKHTTNNQ